MAISDLVVRYDPLLLAVRSDAAEALAPLP